MNILVMLLILFYSVSLYAIEPKMYIFFINGVNTTADDANAHLEKLEDLMNYESNTITWNVLYNATHGLIKSDLIDFMKQKYKDDFPGRNLDDIVNQFNNKFKGDKNNVYILIIAHSQGNNYANQLYAYLVHREHFPADRVGIFSIASPAHSIDGFVNPDSRFKYVTADNDRIINLVNSMPGYKPMPANVHLHDCKDFVCHGLVTSYLFDKEVSKDICKGIKSYITLWLNEYPVC